MAEIMETDVTDTGVFERGLPRAFDDANWATPKADDESFCLAAAEYQFRQPLAQRDLPGFSLGGFRVRDEQQRAGEVDVLPPLAGDLAPAHAGIEREDDHGPQMILRGAEQRLLLGDTEHLATGPAFARHSHPGERVDLQKLLVKGPVENVPKHAQVPIDGGLLDGGAGMPLLAELVRERLGEPQHGGFREEWQQELEVIEMVRADRAAGDEAGGEFAESHCRVGFDDLEALVGDFLLELGFDGLGLPAVGSPGGRLMADTVFEEVRPPDAAAFKQAHVVFPPCCWFSIQRIT